MSIKIQNPKDTLVVIFIYNQNNAELVHSTVELLQQKFPLLAKDSNVNWNQYQYQYQYLTIESKNLTWNVLKAQLSQSISDSISYGVIPYNILITPKKLVAFDMDSTLVSIETLNEFASSQNLKQEVSQITEQAMLGKIDYNDSFKKRIKLLKGVSVDLINQLANQLTLNSGVDTFLCHLNKEKLKKAIISGGLKQFGSILHSHYHFDYMFLNEIDIQDNKISGTVSKEIVNTERKAEILSQLIINEKLKKEETVSIGDGANDVLMFNQSGLSIAFNGKPKAKDAAHVCLNNLSMDAIIPLVILR